MAESAARKEIGLSSLLGAEKSSKPDELKRVPLNSLHIPPEYPRKDLSDKDRSFCWLQTKTHGIDEPLLVIPHPKGYEVIDGMRRLQGAVANEWSNIQVIVKHSLDRETAVYRMCDSYVRERPEMLRSERGRAYQKMLEIANRQGQRTDLVTSSQDGRKLPWSDEIIAESLDISTTTLHRFISYLKLNPVILEQVDMKSISTEGADNLVQLNEEQQLWVAYNMEKYTRSPTTEQTAELKKLAKANKLTDGLVEKIMQTDYEAVADKVTLNKGFLQKFPYFQNKTPLQIEKILTQALTEFFKNHSKATPARSTAPPDRGDGAQ